MINRIINEIKVCLNTNCFIAALTTALTLPDICGKAEFPSLSTTERYKKWYDKYIGVFEKSKHNVSNILYLSSDIVYSLRNNTLHQGTYNIDGEKYDIQEFTLLVESPNRAILQCSAFCIEEQFEGNKLVKTRKKMRINVVDLIIKLCKCSQSYYENNKEKFDFMKNKITTITFQVSKMIKVNRNLDYDNMFKLNEHLKIIKWY